MDSIGDAQGFSVGTLTGITSSWKTELNRSISTVEDRISKWLQHCQKAYCKEDGYHGRWACTIWK